MAGRLQGKIAIITGAGQGIGAATARAFAAEGAVVVVAEKNATTGAAIAKSLNEAGASALFVETDVTSKAPWPPGRPGHQGFRRRRHPGQQCRRQCLYEPLAMPTTNGALPELDLEAAWICSKAALPVMLAKGVGAIVNIASCHAFRIIPHTFPYPVAKHALLGLTRSLGIEYAARGIRVNAIAPGYIETPIAEAYWNTFADPAAEKRRAYDLHPPRRIGRPEEVAMTAVFLASDEAPFINAATITIDGGRSVLYHD